MSDLTAIATSVARREPWRVLRASSITLLVAFCSGTSPPRLLSAFCGQTPSANSFLNWNGRPARAPEAALSIVALPKGRIHERCPALVAPATAEYGTLNSEVKHFDKFCFGFSRLCTSGAPPVWDTGQCGSTPKPQRRGRDQGGRFSFVIFPAVWPFGQGRDRGVNRPEVTSDLSCERSDEAVLRREEPRLEI